ncbi:MAG: hypothetical protein H7Y00_10210 [Fimbriimonadaceae bacterium]|nr:hypothetical protein [Chitinophagales bacterium]
MRRTVFMLILFLIIIACKQTKINSVSNDNASGSIPEKNRISKQYLDSLDRVNNDYVFNAYNINKAFINLSDSSIHLIADMHRDHRIFGYRKPDIKSERLLLISIFTDDVQNNPFNCKLGSYYDTSSANDLNLKYMTTEGEFIKVSATDKLNQPVIIFIEMKWIEFY